MIKVLHIFGLMTRGGAETRTVELMPLMAKKGVQFDYCHRRNLYYMGIFTLGRELSCGCGNWNYVGQAGGIINSFSLWYEGFSNTTCRAF